MNRAAAALALLFSCSFVAAEPAGKAAVSDADAAELRHAAGLLDTYRGGDAGPLEGAGLRGRDRARARGLARGKPGGDALLARGGAVPAPGAGGRRR
jgi:hypothetical protein